MKLEITDTDGDTIIIDTHYKDLYVRIKPEGAGGLAHVTLQPEQAIQVRDALLAKYPLEVAEDPVDMAASCLAPFPASPSVTINIANLTINA